MEKLSERIKKDSDDSFKRFDASNRETLKRILRMENQIKQWDGRAINLKKQMESMILDENRLINRFKRFSEELEERVKANEESLEKRIGDRLNKMSDSIDRKTIKALEKLESSRTKIEKKASETTRMARNAVHSVMKLRSYFREQASETAKNIHKLRTQIERIGEKDISRIREEAEEKHGMIEELYKMFQDIKNELKEAERRENLMEARISEMGDTFAKKIETIERNTASEISDFKREVNRVVNEILKWKDIQESELYELIKEEVRK